MSARIAWKLPPTKSASEMSNGELVLAFKGNAAGAADEMRERGLLDIAQFMENGRLADIADGYRGETLRGLLQAHIRKSSTEMLEYALAGTASALPDDVAEAAISFSNTYPPRRWIGPQLHERDLSRVFLDFVRDFGDHCSLRGMRPSQENFVDAFVMSVVGMAHFASSRPEFMKFAKINVWLLGRTADTSSSEKQRPSGAVSAIFLLFWLISAVGSLQTDRSFAALAQAFVSLGWLVLLGGLIGGTFAALRIYNRKRAVLVALAIMLPSALLSGFLRGAVV